MKTQEKIQLIEALTKVVNANRVTNNENMVDWANNEIKELTESMTKSKAVTEGIKESKPSINLDIVEALLVRFSDVTCAAPNPKRKLEERWRNAIGYTLDDLK